MRCDIIIPVWNQLEYTKDCLAAIMRNTSYPYRLILVDNGSGPDTREYLEGVKRKAGADIELIRNSTNLGFVKAVNQGLAASRAPYVCVMNNDTIPASGWLEAMVDFARTHPDVGLINPQCNGHGEMAIDDYAKTLAKNRGQYMEMNQCQGFCMLIKREVIDKIGYLDTSFGIGGFDDTDYSMRAHLANYRSVAIRDSYVYHRLHGSFDEAGNRDEWVKRNQKVYYDKWGKHLRVGMAIPLGSPDAAAISKILLFAHGLAREWSWVYIWLNSTGDKGLIKKKLEEAMDESGLAPHQNIRIDYFNLPKIAFDMVILGKLLERLRPRMHDKRFDSLVTSDSGIIKFLGPFVKGLGVGSFEASFNEDGSDWYDRGRETALAIKKEVRK